MPDAPALDKNPTGFLSPAFGPDAFRVDRSSPIVFVCGGTNSDGKTALRHQFLEAVTKLTHPIVPILAENSFPHQLIERNLQKFEEFLATAANCVLIFAESVGSFAETGMLAALPMVVKKTFVINTRAEAEAKSFLNLGPIKLIRKSTDFDTIVDLDTDTVTAADADRIIAVILDTYPKYENALVFHPKRKFPELELRLQLACVHMTVILLRAASAPLVTSVLRNHFKAVDSESVERYLPLLTSMGILQRSDELYFNPAREVFKSDRLIHSVSFPIANVMAKALEWQATNNSQASTFLREHRGVDI
jgi:hypothetical protein